MSKKRLTPTEFITALKEAFAGDSNYEIRVTEPSYNSQHSPTLVTVISPSGMRRVAEIGQNFLVWTQSRNRHDGMSVYAHGAVPSQTVEDIHQFITSENTRRNALAESMVHREKAIEYVKLRMPEAIIKRHNSNSLELQVGTNKIADWVSNPVVASVQFSPNGLVVSQVSLFRGTEAIGVHGLDNTIDFMRTTLKVREETMAKLKAMVPFHATAD